MSPDETLQASIGYPWIFNEIGHFLKTGEVLDPPSLEERVETVKKHLKFSIEWKGEKKGIFEMRRHYTNYFKGIKNFKPVRMQLVTSEDKDRLMDILNEIPVQFSQELQPVR